MIISIDGTAGAGKSTVGIRLAKAIGFNFLDAGVFFRSLALLMVEQDIDSADETALASLAQSMQLEISQFGDRVTTNRRIITELIRTRDVDNAVVLIARRPLVQNILHKIIRAAIGPSTVAVGRQIGTTVFPNADLKVWLNGSLTVRSARRHNDFVACGICASLEEVAAELRKRDELDGLEPPHAALELDCDHLTASQIVEQIIARSGLAQITQSS